MLIIRYGESFPTFMQKVLRGSCYEVEREGKGEDDSSSLLAPFDTIWLQLKIFVNL